MLGTTARINLAWSLTELGEFAEALGYAEAGARFAEETNHPFSRLQASYALGLAHLRRGEFAAGHYRAERGLAVCQELNLKTIAFQGAGAFLGEAYLAAGPDSPKLSHSWSRWWSWRPGLGLIANYLLAPLPLADAYLRTGRRDAALRLAADALGLARKHRFRGIEAWALRFHGELHQQQDLLDLAEAERSYRAALALATELGMRPLEAHCHLGLGKLYLTEWAIRRGAGRHHHRHRHVPYDADDLLAARGGCRAGAGAMTIPDTVLTTLTCRAQLV